MELQFRSPQNDIAQRLNEWLKNAAHPDEIFFATLNYNPKLGTPGAYLGMCTLLQS